MASKSSTERKDIIEHSQTEAKKKLEKVTMKETKERPPAPWFIRVLIALLSGIFTFVSTIGKFVLVLYDIFVPPELRELAPLLQMYRKYVLTAAELLSGKKAKEVIEVEHQLDELKRKEELMMKAYPIRRGVGEGINILVSTLVIVIIPIAIWGERLDEKLGLHPLIIAVFFGTALLIVSWIAAIMGPIYALFHKCSMIMVEKGAYRLALIFQDLENIFALPYYAAKSSFSFFDAPPISAETLEGFKLEIAKELDEMKEKVQGLLALDADQVPQRSKEILEELLKEAAMPLEKLDITEIQDKTARAFALVIYSKESSLLPWRRDKGLESFARAFQMSKKEAKRTIELIVKKIREGYISEHLFTSLLITGALKAIAKLEEKYQHILSDMEYNKLAVSLALGFKQYLFDRFTREPLHTKILKNVGLFFYALILPLVVLLTSFYRYFEHLIKQTVIALKSAWKLDIFRFISIRYKEIRTTLLDVYFSVKERGQKLNVKEEFGLDIWNGISKGIKLILRIVLALPLGIWSIIKGLYKLIRAIVKGEAKATLQKRKFEKELSTEALVSMYSELYDKVILSDFQVS